MKIPLPAFGSRFNRAQLNTLRRAWGHAEVTAGAQIRHNGMHRARCAHNGVNRTRLNTFGAANAVGFVDNRKGTNRLLGLFIAVDRRFGRGTKLTAALLLLGTSTVAVAFLPGHEQIGNWSAVLLAAFRIGQGLALGGAWDGLASLLALSAPQIIEV